MTSTDTVYDQLCGLIFSGELPAGSNLLERDLADRFGVSRIPVREALTKLVAQGTLVGGRKGEGVRIRHYSANDLRQLYDYRATIEGGVARSASHSATDADILKLTMICDGMEAAFDEKEMSRWGELDRRFHEALAEASHNERFERALKSLLRECFYVFYVLARKTSRQKLTTPQLDQHKQTTLDDHRALIKLIQLEEADEAETRARLHISRSQDRVIRAVIEKSMETGRS
jgi:DNA-binding GntR family transcriptional regulator